MAWKTVFRVFMYLFVGGLLFGKWVMSPDKTLDELAPKYLNAASKFIAVDGINVHYRDEGQGTPVLLIHGTGASLHTWDAWAEELSKSYRVIRLDLPAYGLTGADPQKRYLSTDYVALINKLTQALGIERLHLVGNSLGGLVAWLYASTYPDAVDRLVLIDPSGFPFDQTPAVIQLAKLPVFNLFLRYFTPKAFIRKNLREVFYNDALITDALVDRYYDLTCFEGNRQAFIDRAKIEREDYTHRLASIEAATLILWGENDAWIPVTDATRFKNAIPQSQVHIMPKTGHVPMEERPQESLSIALAFLEED